MLYLDSLATDLIAVCVSKANPCMEGSESGVAFIQTLPKSFWYISYSNKQKEIRG